jgi:glutamine amidotransferase
MREGSPPGAHAPEHERPVVIALVDYGAGNLTSVRKALAAVGAEVWTPSVPGELARAHGIIVPGVGHFDSTAALDASWRAAIANAIGWKAEGPAPADPAAGIPLLGICVGLQWLFEGSDESADVRGMALFTGTCFNFTSRLSAPLKVPHVGWNSLVMPKPSRLMAGIADGTQVYFTHSYAAPVTDSTVAFCEYGVPFSAAVECGNVSAVQFHPEKSGDAGLRILSNWVSLSRRSAGRATADLSRRSAGERKGADADLSRRSAGERKGA